MRLRSIELKGFKTFGTGTKLELSPGLTAVVGPNGSGKSNLADAFAWVLGEQANSALRIKRSRDLIYQPINGHPSSNMVEVQISIEDSEGVLSSRGSGYDINRVGYQDGDSEYRLNGRRTRLNQIREVFAPFGMAKRSFSLIRQGYCEQFLSVSPFQRLRIIEEAAGALGLIHRKQASERRLSRISLHLAPVHQEMRELKVSLSHLEKQARQFERRQQLVEELRLALVQFYLPALEAAQAEQVQTALELSEINNEQRDAEASFQERRLEASQIQGQIRDLDSQLEATRQALSQAEQAYVTQLSKTQVLKERGNNLARLRNQVGGKQESEENALAAAQTRLTQHRRSRAILADKYWEMEQELSRSIQKAVKSRKAWDRNQKAKERFETELKELTTVHSGLENERIMLRWQQRHEENAAQRLESDLRDARKENSHVQDLLALLQTEIQDISREKQNLANRLDVFRNEASRARNELLELQQIDSTLNSQQAKLQARQDYLTEISQQSAAPFARLPGMEKSLGQLAALLYVNPVHQAGIAACLGEWQFSYVFRTWRDAQQVWREAHRTKNTADLRLAVLEAVPEETPSQMADAILMPAVQAITGMEEIGPLIGHLLAGFALAQDAHEAVSCYSNRLEKKYPFIATLRGDILAKPGVIKVRGGGGGREGLLNVAYESQELQLKGKDFTLQQEETHKRAQRKAAELARTESKVKSVGITVQKFDLELQRKRQGVELAKERIHTLCTNINVLDTARAGHSKSSKARQTRLLEIESKLTNIERKRAEIVDSLEDLFKAIKQLELEFHEGPTTELQEKKATLSKKLEALKFQERQEAGICVTLNSSIHQLLAESKELEDDWTKLLQEEEKAANNLTEFELHVQALREEMAPLVLAEQNLDGLREAQTESFAQERDIHHRFEAQRRQLELRQFGLTERLSWLRRTLSQDVELLTGQPVDEVGALEFLRRLNFSAAELEFSVDETMLGKLRRGIHRCGQVDPDLYSSYQSAYERYQLLKVQTRDLDASESELEKVITQLGQELDTNTQRAFEQINRSFGEYFGIFFPGGRGWLELQKGEGELEAGLEMHVQLPSQRLAPIAALSGGEKAMTAIAFLYALLKFNQPPFCVLDEIDAALDESNIGRIGSSLRELARHTQFILITHNQHMLDYADSIFGITKNADGTSQLLSMELHPELFA